MVLEAGTEEELKLCIITLLPILNCDCGHTSVPSVYTYFDICFFAEKSVLGCPVCGKLLHDMWVEIKS